VGENPEQARKRLKRRYQATQRERGGALMEKRYPPLRVKEKACKLQSSGQQGGEVLICLLEKGLGGRQPLKIAEKRWETKKRCFSTRKGEGGGYVLKSQKKNSHGTPIPAAVRSNLRSGYSIRSRRNCAEEGPRRRGKRNRGSLL